MPAPAPMQFQPLQFAQAPNNAQAGQGLLSMLNQQKRQAAPASPSAPDPTQGAAGAGLPGNPYAGPVAPSMGSAPAAAAPGAAAPGATPPGPSVTDIIRNMTPPQIANWLQNTSTPNIAQAIMPPGMQPGGSQPGSAALFGAGMLPAANMGSTFGG